MSTELLNGSNKLGSNGHSARKVASSQSHDVRRQNALRSKPLQKKLEQRLQKSRRKSGNGIITAQPNGIARYKNGSSKRHRADKTPLFSMDSDSDEELNVKQYAKSPNVSISQNSKELAECEERLLKDGYRLDEMSDEEDLDLIPPRHIENRCCGIDVSQGCIIS